MLQRKPFRKGHSKNFSKNINTEVMSLPRKELHVTYKGHDLLDLFLLHKIVQHVKYHKLRDFGKLWLKIEESDYESIIISETSKRKRVQTSR